VVPAVSYIAAGALHFIRPAAYLRTMPPHIPWRAAMVRVSGAFEILGGIGLFVPATRRAVACARVCASEKVCPAPREDAPLKRGVSQSETGRDGGLVALLIAVFRPTSIWRCIR